MVENLDEQISQEMANIPKTPHRNNHQLSNLLKQLSFPKAVVDLFHKYGLLTLYEIRFWYNKGPRFMLLQASEEDVHLPYFPVFLKAVWTLGGFRTSYELKTGHSMKSDQANHH